PSLSVNHASSADNATNASQLGGHAAGDYVLAHSRGVALAGARIGGGGEVETWFNTLGGNPTVSHTGGSGGYDVAFPGISNASQMVIQGTVENVGGLEVEGLPDGAVGVITFN